MCSIKRDNNSVVLSALHILLDIEGTTSSICFVKDVLFPYVRNQLEEHLDKNWETSVVQEIVQNLKAQAKDDEEKKVEGVIAIPDSQDKQTVLQAVINNVKWQMDNDRKTKCLKDLQGLIMEEGYKRGELKGHVYDDVEPSLKSWTEDNRSVYIYSSGSVNAQKLLFGHSEKGDLLPLIKGHFDTAVGMKGDAASYKKILEELSCNATDVAFFTDVPTEARAAKNEGITAILLSREGNAPLTDADKAEFPVITSFTEIEFENNCKKRKMCSETDVTNENKQVTNCAVSFEGGSEPSDPNLKSNDDVEMMEVEESSTTEDSSIEQKVELKEEKKAELKEEKKVECREKKKVELGEEKMVELGEEKIVELEEEKKVELGKEIKVENGVQGLNCKENEDTSKHDNIKIVDGGSETVTENTNTNIEPVVNINEKGVEIVNKDKIEETREVNDHLSDTEINSERSENKMEDESSENPVEASAEDSKVNVENISENYGQPELKEENMGKPSEKNMETLEGDSKEKSEVGVEANCGSELKLEKNTSEGKVETHEDKLKENCDNKNEDSCRTESSEDKGLGEDKTSEEHLTTIEKKSKDNTENLILNSVPSGTNISTKSLQEKERAEIADVESNADKTNIASTETSLLEADKEGKSQSAIAITQESVSHERNTENQTENNIEFTKDDINKPSPENPSIVHEKLTEKKDLDSQENILTSNSSREQSTSEKDSRINNEDVKIEESMEIEPRVEQEDMAVQDSDGSVEVKKSCESIEDESTSELKTESHNSESVEEGLELKSSVSKKEPEMDSAKSPIEKSKFEPIQDKSNADCKSDLKMEESTLSEIVPDQNQKTLISENETVNVEIKKATSEHSLAITSDNVNNTQMDCETEQIVTEGKQKGACIEDCKTRVNGDSDELMETESQTNTVVLEKKENLGEKCKDTDDKVKESEDDLEKLNDKTKSNTTCANETISNKEEFKTETKVAPLAENNKLNAESNGLAKEKEETGVKTNVISPSHQTTLDEQVSVNGTGKSEVGNVSNGNAVESQLNGSSSPDVKQEISNDNDVKPIEGKKCDSTENSTPMETVVEA